MKKDFNTLIGLAAFWSSLNGYFDIGSEFPKDFSCLGAKLAYF